MRGTESIEEGRVTCKELHAPAERTPRRHVGRGEDSGRKSRKSQITQGGKRKLEEGAIASLALLSSLALLIADGAATTRVLQRCRREAAHCWTVIALVVSEDIVPGTLVLDSGHLACSAQVVETIP